MAKKHILLIGGYTSTNIGNGFYEMGVKYMLSNISDEFVVHCTSDLSLYYWDKFRAEQDGFEPAEHFRGLDYIVWMGPVFDAVSMKKWKDVLERAGNQGSRIMCLGAGSSQYTKEEVAECKKILKKYPFYILISRDTWTYKAYKDDFTYAYDGICPAFFSSLCFQKWKLDMPPFAVFDFEQYTEPDFIRDSSGFAFHGGNWQGGGLKKRTVVTEMIQKYPKEQFDGLMIIRTKNTCIRPENIGGKYRGRNIYLSDVPEDYLNIYANAQAVFSDRVHACAGALAQGTPAMFFGRTPRAKLFERFFKNHSAALYSKPVSLDMNMLDNERNRQLDFLRKVLMK